MRHLDVVASVAAAIIVLAAFGAYYGLTALNSSSSFPPSSSSSSSSPTSSTSVSSTPSPCTVFQGSDGRITTTCSYSSSTSTCTLYLVSGGFTATAGATSTGEICEPLIGVIEVLGCPTATSSITACSGPRYASFSAGGTSTNTSLCSITHGSSCTASTGTIGAAVPRDQRIEIDLFGALPTLRCTSSNCSSVSLLSSVLDSCCRLADQYTFSAPGEYAFTASWTPVPSYLTACTFVSYSTTTSATSTPYCTSASGTVTAANFSTQQFTFVLNVS
jgi:mucin-6/19